MNKLNHYFLLCILALIPVLIPACGGSGNDEPDVPPTTSFDVDFVLPASIVLEKGGTADFVVNNQKSPLTTDIMQLENSSGLSFEFPVVSTSSTSFSVKVPDKFESGNYRVYMKRGDRKKSFGTTSVQAVNIKIQPAADATVYGLVTDMDENPVEGVLVSDGVEIVSTDSRGVYNMNSRKDLGYVFYILPSGYEPVTDGVLPKLHGMTKLSADMVERLDFVIKPVADPDNYKVLFFGDMHLADRTNDLSQFSDFLSDVTKYRAANPGEKMYGITLGDMTWDLYWYSRKFCFPEYLKAINAGLKNMCVFHTIGNHDNDMKATNNLDAKLPYRNQMAPNYYSFNLGKAHYIMLDDIDCSTYDGTESRNYVQQVVSDQIVWLANDLKHVSKSTPVFIMMHAPVYYPNSATGFKADLGNASQLLSTVSGYDVHFVTGHTHKTFNVTPNDAITGGAKVHEHNVGAVCSDWWWSGNLTPGCLVSTDGTPSGYAIWDFNGTQFSYIYKGTHLDTDVQFRTYDLNNVSFSFDDVPLLTNTSMRAKFQRYITAYPANSKNEVLINVWNYNRNWKVTVKTEGGATLSTTAVMAYDPLHIAAQTVKRFNSSTLTSEPSFTTQSFPHFFKVTAPDATTDLVITVTDEFGNVSTETMHRPKAFNTEAYKR